MYIYIYIGFGQGCFLLQSGNFFVSPKKNLNEMDDYFLLWPVSTNECNSKLCRSEILIKAQTKEVWPLKKKLRVGERSFFFPRGNCGSWPFGKEGRE